MVQIFISSLKNKINDKSIAVKLTKAPSYLTRLLPLDNIILVHKFERKIHHLNEKETCDLSEEDITGCPLEVDLSPENVSICCSEPFDYNKYLEEKEHLPLSLSQARNILNLCNLNLYPPNPVWIVTDGNDSQRTVLLSSYKSNGWITRSWVIYKGISDVPSIESLKQIHLRLCSTQNAKISCQVRCTYNIRNEICEYDPQEVYSFTSLQASWNTFKISPPSSRSTEFTLMTKCKIGKGSGGLLFLWRELLLINQYIDIIESQKNVCLNSNVTLPSCTSYFESIKKTPSTESTELKIRKILKEQMRVYSNVSDGTSLKDIVNLFSSERPEMDVTDKFWYIFIECSTYQQLEETFKQIFIELKKMGVYTPYVTSSNISRLADCLQKGAAILNPLQYVVEVGLDKLKKEILFIFSKAQVASLNSLNMPKLPKFSEVSESEWLSTVQKWIQWFCQVQCVLELLCNSQKAIYIAKDPMLALVSKALNLFTGPDSHIVSLKWLLENQLQEIKTNLPFTDVKSRLSNPVNWVLSLNSDLDGRKVQSVFSKSINHPFVHVTDKSENTDDASFQLTEDSKYYWAELFSVSDEIDM
ncbi:hypothetical protein O3M35_013039 [Rhynocoris fuscipes]|uniref:Protein zwilch n=1 Tax=Rhynocoris fuscipes TaxID=488301 RepID=A0AAW1CF99_9HEMI